MDILIVTHIFLQREWAQPTFYEFETLSVHAMAVLGVLVGGHYRKLQNKHVFVMHVAYYIYFCCYG